MVRHRLAPALKHRPPAQANTAPRGPPLAGRACPEVASGSSKLRHAASMQPPIRRFDWHVPVDVRHVAEAARVLGVSEFEIFRLAYRFWYQRELHPRVFDETFADYLLREKVPSWARDYCRRLLNLAAVGQLDPRDFGVDRPGTNRLFVIDRVFSTAATLAAFFIYLFFLG